MRLIDADALKEQIRKGLGVKSLKYLLPAEKYIVEKIDRMPTIQPVQRTDLLKAEIKRMKRSFTTCINSDYYTGYMSALSTVEGCIAKLEGGDAE